ncbi:MdlB ABC-type multidrug transport system, ATPase and permease components [Burkholderiaceae bacterium]
MNSCISADLRALWRLLGGNWRRRFWGLMLLSLVASACEILSIGSLLPFLVILTDPQQLSHWPVVGQWLQTSDPSSHQPAKIIVVFLGLAFGMAVLTASLIRWWLFTSCSRYTYQLGGFIGQDIFRRALLQPYAFHLTKTSSEIIDVITSRVQMLVSSVLMAGLQLLTSLVMVLAFAGVLLWINPQLAGTALVGFGLVYLLIYRASRWYLSANSKSMSQVGDKRYKMLQEGMGGIRDIHIDGTHEYFVNAFKQADEVFRHAQSQNAIISASPKYLVEGLGTLFLAGLAVAYATHSPDTQTGSPSLTSIVPMLGVLVLSAQRLLPLMQQIYAGWTSIRGMADTLHIVRQWLQLEVPQQVPLQPSPQPLPMSITPLLKPVKPGVSKAFIELNDVSFAYQPSMPRVLNHINLTIYQGQTIGLFGTTGGGKSTLLDILMGLLEPTTGQLLVDGKVQYSANSNPDAGAWRRHIAHVSQHIFLANASITRNIAFGLPSEAIDHDRIQLAIVQAHLFEFCDSLPQGLDTEIGERGIRLSGGQRQRIGIARALYKRASLLVLDEATSALDPITEEAITQSLARLHPELTIVMVSHRPSALKHCDVIYRVEQGRLHYER